MTEGATKEEVRQILREELEPLRKDVIEPLRKDVGRLYREVYGEFGDNGLRTKVKENTNVRRQMRWLWGTVVAAVIGGATTWLFNIPWA